MKYAQIRPFDIANGPGIRVSVFVSGCTHRCKGCFNEDYQDFSYGESWTRATTETLLSYLLHPSVSGLTVLGGEPFQNAKALSSVIEELAHRYEQATSKTLNLWIYTGYTYEELLGLRLAEEPRETEASGKMEKSSAIYPYSSFVASLLRHTDVLVDGRFVESKKNGMLLFRGSSNQRLIDVRQTLRSGKLHLYSLETSEKRERGGEMALSR